MFLKTYPLHWTQSPQDFKHKVHCLLPWNIQKPVSKCYFVCLIPEYIFPKHNITQRLWLLRLITHLPINGVEQRLVFLLRLVNPVQKKEKRFQVKHAGAQTGCYTCCCALQEWLINNSHDGHDSRSCGLQELHIRGRDVSGSIRLRRANILSQNTFNKINKDSFKMWLWVNSRKLFL